MKIRLNLADLINSVDPNVMWDQVYSHVYEILSVICPFKRYKQRESLSPWINAEIYRAMRYSDSLINLYKATKNCLYITLARTQRNLVNSLIERAKRNLIMTTLDNNASVQKKFWRQINILLKGKDETVLQTRLFDPATKSNVPLGSEGNFLNSYFCNIAERLECDPKENIDYDSDVLLSCYDRIENVFDILHDLPTLGDIAVHADDIDINKGSCVDGISSSICRDLLKLAPEFCLAIFKKSVETGIFPENGPTVLLLLSKNLEICMTLLTGDQ